MSTARKVMVAAGAVVALAAIYVAPVGSEGEASGAGAGGGGVVGVVCRAPGGDVVPAVAAAAPVAAPAAGAGKTSIPIVGRFMVTSDFGPRWGTNHNGIDLATSKNEPTLAFMAGTVVAAGPNGGAGNWVRLDHGGGLFTVYMHHSQVLVTVGQQVAAGQQIGVQGSTGDSSGPHLHFEVWVNGAPVEPRAYVANAGLTIPAENTWGEGPAAPGLAAAGGAVVAAAAVLPECTPEQMQPVSNVETSVPATGAVPADLNAAAVPEWALPWIVKAGAMCPEIPATIIAAQIDQESKWNPKAVSPAGAAGLSQFMPDTWKNVGKDSDGNGVISQYDIGDAIIAQGTYDCMMVDYARAHEVPGDILDLALAGYNAGPHRLTEFNGVPPYKETQDYIPLIKGMAADKYANTK